MLGVASNKFQLNRGLCSEVCGYNIEKQEINFNLQRGHERSKSGMLEIRVKIQD